MRYFSPFAILGLLHVARGGELDAFASDRARNIREGLAGRSVPVVDTSNTSSPTPRSDLPNAFKRELERREAHKRALDHLDTNGDDHVDHDEIINSLAIHWKGGHNARRMLRAFGAPDLEGFMKRSSPNDDGRVPKETLTQILDKRPLDDPDYCPAIRTKVESCPTHAVLKCGAYLTAAEFFCNAGVKSLVEKCIMSESCDNMCRCITAVEDAAHGDAAILDQGQIVQVDHFNSVGHPESSLHARQFGEEILIGAFIWAIIEFIVGITAAYIIGNIYASLTSANPWMDTVGWDGNGLEPPCSSFVFWGHCGAILSGTARNCPNGGQRVFGNSCKDHFRYGSQGCGFLGLGCQSLCSKVNPTGCPCSLFDWSEFDNQDMPGFDMDKGSFFTSKVSVCRNACAGNSTCQAFAMAPFSGNEKDKRPNCFLKTAQRPTQTVQGSTVFFKRSKNGNCGAPTVVTGVSYDDDWFSTSTGTDRRSLPESGHALLPRAHQGEVPFPFDRSVAGITTELTWRNNPLVQRPIGATTASSHTGGGSTGRPSDAPYLSNLALPQWRPTEVAYRVNGMFRNIINTAITQNVDDPVARWLNQNPSTTPGQRAQFPDSVRQLLLANSAVVHNINRGNGVTWIGQNTRITGGDVPPFPGVRAGYDQSMGFYQRGGVGPFSIEAAFLMATQVAGINFRAVARAYQANPAGWWMGVMNNGPNSRECLQENDSNGLPVRTYGRFESGAGSTQHDPRAGVYMAFDLDPTLSATDPNHNVFVFVVHAIDANSVVGATEAQLRAVNVGASNNWEAQARFSGTGDRLPILHQWQMLNQTQGYWPCVFILSIPTVVLTDSAYPMVRKQHAHAAIVTRAAFDQWVTGSTTTGFPSYTQISYMHMYILTEDVSLTAQDDPNDWPRKQFFNNGAGQ